MLAHRMTIAQQTPVICTQRNSPCDITDIMLNYSLPSQSLSVNCNHWVQMSFLHELKSQSNGHIFFAIGQSTTGQIILTTWQPQQLLAKSRMLTCLMNFSYIFLYHCIIWTQSIGWKLRKCPSMDLTQVRLMSISTTFNGRHIRLFN